MGLTRSFHRFMCQLMDWRKSFGVFDKPRVYFFTSYRHCPPRHPNACLLPVTLCSVADSRVVPKLQPISPYPLRSAWQSASVAVVATRDCIFHYVSDSCPHPQLNASRDLILFLQRYPTRKTLFTFIINSHCHLTFHRSPSGMKRHPPTLFPFLAPAANLTD